MHFILKFFIVMRVNTKIFSIIFVLGWKLISYHFEMPTSIFIYGTRYFKTNIIRSDCCRISRDEYSLVTIPKADYFSKRVIDHCWMRHLLLFGEYYKTFPKDFNLRALKREVNTLPLWYSHLGSLFLHSDGISTVEWFLCRSW